MAKQKTYAELLQDPIWQRMRLEIMQRDDFTCTRCKSGSVTLHVHHKKYIKGRLPWEYEKSNFETLCKVCHSINHKLIAPENKEHIAMLIAIRDNDENYINAANTHIKILMNTLSKGVPGDVEEEILKNIVYLQSKIKEYKNG